MYTDELKEYLEAKLVQYNQPKFIQYDPVQIPHLFKKQQDIEISGFFASIFAWGQRPTIIRKSKDLMERMDMAPYEFILHADDKDLLRLDSFVHRTFNGTDARHFVKALNDLYTNNKTLGDYFGRLFQKYQSVPLMISGFKKEFFSLPHQSRTQKHIADPLKGSTAKRLNMFLRWMVRKDDLGVDFGLWDSISSSELYLPLDVHSARIARKLGLLERKTNDWKAVEEITQNLRKLDARDPVKYDYALFGTGVFEKF
ncbi:MAG: TIGR02757 family protein [Bacteroidales bacterium]|nr:TIGR02757 family protein [Bacteroidales bacterium]MCF8327594.1 TIGR02757 family protein [Bacteroidales bacterium]